MKKKIIEVKNLTKKYNNESKFALDHINLSISQGSIFGLLGPNGAGKSTFINILAGLVNKNYGSVKVCGVGLDDDPKTLRGSLGIVPQEIIIDPFFTPIEIMNIQAGLYAVKKENNINLEILEMLDLGDKAEAYSRSLSGGMKRRLMVAKAMVHNPPILILDEPTAGVDVELRKKLWNSIRKLNKKGTTIILTTHYLKEAELLCDEIAVINKGKVIANDTKNNLLKILDEKEIKIEFTKKINKIPSKIKKFCVNVDNNLVTFKFKKSQTSAAELIKEISDNNLVLKDISTKESDLEDIFIKLLNT
tara:strand:+ start:4030 stop:4944 length:915 start_codon:yes stop_codon:yes gene_type:complete